MKKVLKKAKKKSCRHEFGKMKYESDEPRGWQVCFKCRRTKFEGDNRIS